MNKIAETPFKLTNLQPALKKLADKHHRNVRISWNELFLEINNIYSTNAFVLFCANWIACLYFISSELFSKQNTIFRKIIGRGQFSSKVPLGGRFYKRGWRPLGVDRGNSAACFCSVDHSHAQSQPSIKNSMMKIKPSKILWWRGIFWLVRWFV